MTSYHTSKTRLGALILAVAITFAQLPVTVFTADTDTTSGPGGLITAFGDLGKPYEAFNSGSYRVTVPAGIPSDKLPLPKELPAIVASAEGENAPVDDTVEASALPTKIAVTWAGDEYDAQTEGLYLFTPILPDTYSLAQDALLPDIYVDVHQTDCICESRCIPYVPNIECPHCATNPEDCASNPDSCICISKCTEDTVNSYCPYCADNWQECSYEQGLKFGEYPSFGRRFGLMRSSGPVVTEDATYDVYMNVDSALGMDVSELKNLVSEKLATLIAGNPETDEQTYRILTSQTTIDTTDLRYWYVYDHYDTAAWPGSTSAVPGSKWIDTYKEYKMYGDSGRQRPYQAVQEYYQSVGGATTIKYLLDQEYSLNAANRLAEHVYAGADDSGSFMIFDGYGSSPNDFTDFLFYPATSKGVKTVNFTVNASEVEPHSMESAGFLCNVGVSEDDVNGNISGYVVAFGYKNGSNANPSGGVKANNYNYIRLYKIKNNVSALAFSKSANSGGSLKIATYADLVASVTPPTFYAQTDIRLSIQETSINLEMRNSSDPSAAYTQVANWTTTPTGYQGFGPYVAYEDSGHSCSNVSAFRFSNLKMSFAENISSDSLLSALASADYLDKGENRYFVNLIGSKDYAQHGAENDQDKAYISQMQAGNITLITDATSSASTPKIYPEHYLGDNSRDVNTHVDRDDANFKAIWDSANTSAIDTKAAEIAWLIYKGTWKSDGVVAANPTTTAVSKLILTDGAPGVTDKPWEGANQVNTVQKELMGAEGLKVYLNPDESKNASGLTVEYTLTKPDGTVLKLVNGASHADELEVQLDSTQNNKPYFVVGKDWAQGDYTVSLKHQPNDTITQTIPSSTKFSVSIDTTSPTVSKPVTTTTDGKATVSLGCVNTPSVGNNTYTSDLGYYAVVITDSAAVPTAPTDKTAITGEQPLPTSYTEPSVVNRAAGTHYAHVFVWDQAGNVGVSTEAFTVTGPGITMTKPIGNLKDYQTEEDAFDARDPVTGKATVSFDLSGSTYEVASYTVKTSQGYDVTVTEVPADGEIDYELPAGKYELTLIVTDMAGNHKELSFWVDAKKTQSFRDDAHKVDDTFVYLLEAGKDAGVALAMSNSSDFAEGDVRPSPMVEFTLPVSDPKVIGLVNGVMTPLKLGTVTITAKAAETASHYGAQQEITVRVIPALSVDLVAGGYGAEGGSGISLTPSHTLGAYPLSTDIPPSLRYREVGSREWTNIPTWSWDSNASLLFADLKPDTKYEVELSATDTRPATPTIASKLISFRTPAAGSNTGAGKGLGTVEVGVTDVEANKVVNVSIQVGSTVLTSITLTGPATDGDVSHTFTDLPDGVYNVVFAHEGKVVTDVVEIKNGQASKAVIIPFAALASRETRVVHENDNAPQTVVGGLNNQYAQDTLAGDANKGITQEDLDAIEEEVDGAKGSALLELKVKGVLETDNSNTAETEDAIHKIKEKSAGQSFALFADLSLWKTITPARALTGNTTQLIEANALLDITIPLPTIRGSNIRVYRVHDADGAERSEASALAEEIPMGAANANAFGEYCEMTKDSIILHVRLFSLYAIGYNVPDEDNSSGDEFWLTVKDQLDAGKNDDVIYIDAKNYDHLPVSVMDKLLQNPNLSLVIKLDDKNTITIPAGKAVVPEPNRVYYPFSLLAELYKDVTFVKPQNGSSSYFTTKEGKVIPATGVVVEIDEHATSSILPNQPLTQDQIRTLELSRMYPVWLAVAAAVGGLGYLLWYKRRKSDQSV